LDTEVEKIATTLDEVLKDSLWKRTLAHLTDAQRDLERGIESSEPKEAHRLLHTQRVRKSLIACAQGRVPFTVPLPLKSMADYPAAIAVNYRDAAP